ncbi:hypothetical protein [Thiohalophilus thiocyanatoxydans]|uniref:hypothetical protein n=1 Tax=Thiohalophilus thiocyanatoxydans TaxID=381308 RepID=UPI001064C702|nr:hypothetical protein [Thiohalophilus thiocyanatoxydans]
MAFGKKLWQTEVVGLVALLICACLIALYGFVESYLWSLEGKNIILSPSDAAWLGFAYSASFGFLAVLFYGAPLYALLSYKHMAYWWSVALIGAASGTVIVYFEKELGGWLIASGIAVASITHLLSVRFITYKQAL